MLFEVLAVDLAGGCQEEFLAPLNRQSQQHFCWINISFDRAHGIIGDEFHPDCGRHVIDHIDAANHISQHHGVGNRADSQFELGMVEHPLQIVALTGGHVIQHGDGMTLFEQTFGEVATNEARSAGDQAARHAVAFLNY